MRKKKSANGTGSVEFHRGQWRVRVVIDGKRKILDTFATEDEANAARDAHAAEVAAGAIIGPGALTLDRLGAEWLDDRELHGSRVRAEVRDVRNERSVWRRHVAPSPLARMAVQSIRPRDVEAFVRWLRGREAVAAMRTRDGMQLRPAGRSISTQVQRHALRLVRGVLDEARARELIVANAAELVRVRRDGPSADIEDDWLREGEIDTLLACESLSLRDRTAYAFAIGLALRLNDLKALRVEDVHLDAQVPGPHVVASIGKANGKKHRVPVLPWLRPWIEAHLATLPKGARWLFPTSDGGKYASKRFTFGWAEKLERGPAEKPGELGPVKRRAGSALERAGIERRIRFHDLRGTTATHLALGTWGRTWSLHEIQAMLAHADQRVTERYVRRATDMLTAAAGATPRGPAHVKPRGPVAPGVAPMEEETPTNPVGFEPTTFGSGGPAGAESERELTSAGGSAGDNGAERPPSTRAELVRLLSAAAGELATSGDLYAARVAHEALGRLLDAPVADDRRAPVIDLASERAKREGA